MFHVEQLAFILIKSYFPYFGNCPLFGISYIYVLLNTRHTGRLESTLSVLLGNPDPSHIDSTKVGIKKQPTKKLIGYFKFIFLRIRFN